MNKLLAIVGDCPPTSIVTRDFERFYKEMMDKLYTLNRTALFDWLKQDYNICYMALWLHPITSVMLFDPKAKLLSVRTQGDFERGLHALNTIWTSHTDLLDALVKTFPHCFRVTAKQWYDYYLNKWERSTMIQEYLKWNLPIYYPMYGHLISTYSVRQKRNGNIVAIYTSSWNTTLAKFSGHIPYAICFMLEPLKEWLPKDIIRLCVLYALPSTSLMLETYQKHRIFATSDLLNLWKW